MRLDGKVALVTGGGSGIGQAGAVRLAAAGGRVAVLGRRLEKLQGTVDQIKACGDGEAMAVQGDISDLGALRQAVDAVVDQWGRLDVVFANAGINGTWAPIDEMTLEEIQKVIQVNLLGTILTVQAAVPALRRTGSGSIIITSSVNGTRIFSNPGAWAYGATKAAQVAFAKFMAVELAQDGIRVNAICPGRVETEIQAKTELRHLDRLHEFKERIPLTGGKGAQPEHLAELILFLASDASQFITGTELWIDGGQSLMV